MSCPHSLIGSSAMCSQCAGAVAHVVAVDEQTGRLTLDGQPVARHFDAQRNEADVRRARRGGYQKAARRPL